MHDFNTADEQKNFDIIPPGTIAKLHMTIRPGHVGEGGWETASKSSDAVYLSAEFIVTEGEYAKRKIWQNLTVRGGQTNERGESKAGNITRTMIRAMIESALGIDPKDMSEDAKKRRRVNGYGDLNGIEFWAKLGVEPAKGEHKAKNKIDKVITPDMPEYHGGGGSQASLGGGSPGMTGAAPAPQPWQQPKPATATATPAWRR